MTYQVLARKWRPKNFTELVGQQHVLQALTHALDQGRLHHAYLFTGTRGVGKTTLARILAKCLNCEHSISANPCGQCNTCNMIDQGRFVDLFEIDAASRTKVEDTRELLENVPYAPSAGRYKVYLIDEVHMLSGHSFNALLKTLEEPPPHVKFILATTDPKKLPVTVLSRCLQFHLKNLTPEQISQQLQHILKTETIEYDFNALQQIARAAQGSLRDALSLLDQAIGYGAGKVLEPDVTTMLGNVTATLLQPLCMNLIKQDAAALLTSIAALAEQGVEFSQVLEDIISVLQQAAIAQVVPDAISGNSAHLPYSDLIQQISQTLTANDIQLYYQIALIGRRDLSLAPSPRGGFEMILLRMLAFTPNFVTKLATPKQQPNIVNNKTDIPATLSQSKQTHLPPISDSTFLQNAGVKVHSSTMPTHTPPIEQTIPVANTNNDWSILLSQLKLSGLSQVLASHCQLVELDDTLARFELDGSYASLYNAQSQERIATALSGHLNRPIKVQINIASKPIHTPASIRQQQQIQEQQDKLASLKKDPNVQALEQLFDAKIQLDSLLSGNANDEHK